MNKPLDLNEALLQSERRFDSLIELSSDWYWEQDEDHRFTVIKGAGLQHIGLDSKDFLGTARWDRGAVPVGDGGSWDKHKAVLKARKPFADFLYKLVDSKGGWRYVRASGQPMFDEAKRFRGYRGIAGDVTQRVQMDLRLAIEHAVTRVLGVSNSIAEAAPQIIRAICETLGWACGVRREPDKSQGLRCAETWGVAAPGIDAFLESTRRHLPSPGGLSRRTWSERKPMWIRDVAQEASFLRAPDAVKAGVHSAFAFPIKVGAEVIGVMEFFSREILKPDAELLECMTYVGSQIGQFVQRKRAEEEQRRFRAAIDVSADLVFLVDPVNMLYVDANDAACRVLGYSREELLAMGPQDTFSESREELAQRYSQLIAGDLSETAVEGWYRRKDGSRFAVESFRRAVRSGEGHVIVAVTHDVSERKRAEQLLKLEHTVTRALAQSDSARTALEAAIRAVCETAGWDCGRYFRPDDKAGAIRFEAAWGVPHEVVERYIAGSRELAYAPGVGLIGRVWQSGQPLWVSDVVKDVRVAQPALARDTGIHSAFVFPVISEGKTIGVLTFNSREAREPEERLLQTISVIGSQIGQFVRRKQAEEVLRESEERFRSLTELSSDLYWEQDAQYRFTSVAGSYPRQAYVNSAQLIGKKRWEQDYVNMTAEDWAAHREILGAHQPFRDLELCRLDESGKKLWISVSGEPVFDPSGAFKGYRGVGKDITERKQNEERIRHLAHHDALTALPNRTMFSDVLNLALQNARRYQRSFAVLFIDLDRFKVINDTLGHEAGDKLLQEMGARLTQTVRSGDVVFRLGGDEFVVLVQEVSEAGQIEAVARKILSALVKPLSLQGQECRVSASIGICMYPSDAQDEQALMKNADIAMYRAKEAGKNTYKFYSGASDLTEEK